MLCTSHPMSTVLEIAEFRRIFLKGGRKDETAFNSIPRRHGGVGVGYWLKFLEASQADIPATSSLSSLFLGPL